MNAASQDRFTATGRPMQAHKEPSTWEKSCPWGLQAPIHPPFCFTDESIIPVMVYVQVANANEKLQKHERRGSIVRRLTDWWNSTSDSDLPFICVFMPRREYIKHFAHDDHGNYIGSEVQRSWSKKELDANFGQYQHARSARWVMCQEYGIVFMVEEVIKEAA